MVEDLHGLIFTIVFIDAVMITSEKTWYGEKTDGQTAAEFVERANKLNSVVPGANPGRVVESKGENITAIDFETIKNGKSSRYFRK